MSVPGGSIRQVYGVGVHICSDRITFVSFVHSLEEIEYGYPHPSPHPARPPFPPRLTLGLGPPRWKSWPVWTHGQRVST